MAEQFCLRWNNHQSTLISVFESLLESGTLIDCTLYAEGQVLKAHKVVLSACSPCFEKMLCAAEDKNPVIFLKDVKFLELKAMLDYMYRGEVNISQDQLDSFLKTAEALQIKGLTDHGGGGGGSAGGGGGGGTNDVGEPPAKKGPGRKTGVSDVAPESPLVGNAPLREGSISPGGSKRRRRVARRPSADETSADNSCDIPPVAAAAQPQPQQISAPPQATSTPLSVDTARFVVKKQEPLEPPSTSQHNMIQPKTEFIEESNEDIEDLTLDDDDDYTEMSKPGTSFSTALQGNTSQQDFSQWQMMGDRTQTDEVFMAAQEAINNQSNTQGTFLWEFLLRLLDDERCYPYIQWVDKPNGHFKVINSKVVSKMWGLHKNNPEMRFETMARALRYYYQKGILSKVDGQRLAYRFINIPNKGLR